jgi:hypothetical protein
MVLGVDFPEGPVEQTEHGLVCKGDGWFAVNAREIRWYEADGWGKFSKLGGDTLFDQLGFGIAVLGPGQPMSMYRWESDQGGLPRPRRDGDPDRRGTGTPAAAVGLRPLPSVRGAHDRRGCATVRPNGLDARAHGGVRRSRGVCGQRRRAETAPRACRDCDDRRNHAPRRSRTAARGHVQSRQARVRRSRGTCGRRRRNDCVTRGARIRTSATSRLGCPAGGRPATWALELRGACAQLVRAGFPHSSSS